MHVGAGTAAVPPAPLLGHTGFLARARRRHLNIRGKSANLPAITDKDWLDIK